jgi:hypothetical protein
MDAAVRQFLAGVPPNVREIVKALRALVLAAAGPTTESLLWRSLSYHRPELGGRVKGAVCLITPKSDHVELGFIHGALLPDPGHVLTGVRRSKRVVRVTAPAGVRHDKALHDLIRAAAEIRPVGDKSGVPGPARGCTRGPR